MAPHLRLDFYSDADTFEPPSPRRPTSQQVHEPPALHRSPSSFARPQSRGGGGPVKSGTGVAQPRYNDEAAQRRSSLISDLKPQPSIGVARSTDEDNTPPRALVSDLRLDGARYSVILEEAAVTREASTDDEAISLGGDCSEPILHQEQMDDLRSRFHTDEPMSPISDHEGPSKLQRRSMTAAPAPAPAIPWENHGVATPSVTSDSATSPSIFSQELKSSSASSITRMPDFFSHAVFQTILQNPIISVQLLKFARSRHCGENMEFLGRVDRYNALLSEVSKSIYEIHKDFIASSSPTQINIPQTSLNRINAEMRSSLSTTLPMMETIFNNAHSQIEDLVYTDVYPKFARHQMSISTAKALGADKSKYAGLGDCFVLTDPAKADNPIVFASDGFVKVTGYARNEIIPRNCRFLQSRQTDRAAVGRLKASVERKEESVELLLNQRKDGQPFWNLLYTTPLFDGHGNLVFFLGGQINCSTAVHGASDVLRILAQTSEDDQPESLASQMTATPPPKATRSRSFFNALRNGNRVSTPPLPQRAPGMENKLVDRLEEMPLKSQMSTFYTAYSNFIIVNYSTFLISFISGGIVDLLFPIKTAAASTRLSTAGTLPGTAQAVGVDVFKFLATHAPAGSTALPRDFKASVKGALRMGQAISLDLKLCARPYMGFERFASHWTPLKDEAHKVAWVVLTLGSEHRVGMAM